MADNILKLESGAIMSDTHDENERVSLKNYSPPDSPNFSDPPDTSDSPASPVSPTPPAPPDQKEKVPICSLLKKNKGKIAAAIMVMILEVMIGPTIFAWITDFVSLPSEMEQLKTQMDNLTELVETLGTDAKETKKAVEQEKWDRANAISESEANTRTYVMDMFKIFSPTELRPTETMEEAIKAYAGSDDFSPGSGGGELTATTLVAYDVYTRIEYSVEEIANKQVLLPYLDGKKEGYFYGKLSKTGAWDGDCIINVYEDGKLIFIKEAIYDNGRLLSSRQAFPYSFNEDQDVWAISNRTNYGGHSEGETKIYRWEQDYVKRFDREEVAPKDIIDIGTFQKNINPNLFAYYYGSVSGEYFSDKSGTSYMVRFFEDGTVRLLYVGNFENGHFNDDTGDAWYIVKAEDTEYMYYQGKFKNDKIVERVSSLGPPLSLDQIKEIIGDRTFNVELHWDKLGVT